MYTRPENWCGQKPDQLDCLLVYEVTWHITLCRFSELSKHKLHKLQVILIELNTTPERTVIKASAPSAPTRTTIRECRIAIIAAMKNVLSPSSDTMMTDIEAAKAWINPGFPFLFLIEWNNESSSLVSSLSWLSWKRIEKFFHYNVQSIIFLQKGMKVFSSHCHKSLIWKMPFYLNLQV